MGSTTGVAAAAGPAASSVSISPNPVAGELLLNVYAREAAKSPVIITVADVTGRTQYRQIAKLTQGANTIMLQATGLPAGVYFVTVPTDDAVVVKRFEKL